MVGWGGVFVFSLVVLLSLALVVVRLSVSDVVRFSIWFPYKPDPGVCAKNKKKLCAL
jgi:hypothetical protein